MDCTVTWVGAQAASGGLSNMSFLAQTGSGHSIMMDGAANAEQPALGGANLAARPMELLLAGAGGCSAFDVVLMLQRGRHAVQGCTVKISAERADTPPQVFTKIHMHFTVTGSNLPTAAVERAVQMSHEKYCSATIMLGKTAAIVTSFEIQAI